MSTSNGFVNAFVGGWQFSGILRSTSGLPFSFFEPGFKTNWQEEAYGVTTGTIKMHRHFDQNGEPQFFDNPGAINSGLTTGSPERLPYPGETGERNNFRGDGYFSMDSGLAKSWSLSDYRKLKFAWEVYNVTNTVRFVKSGAPQNRETPAIGGREKRAGLYDSSGCHRIVEVMVKAAQ